jgi:hypothetical protein
MSLLKAPYLSVVPQLGGSPIELASGETWVIGPEAGFYLVELSHNHSIQIKDPVSGIWLGIGSNMGGGPSKDGIATARPIYSDGVNVRIANQTGCPVGALLTNAGSGYTSAPTVTAASSGGSIWKAIVGGAVSTTVSIPNAGQNYTYPPIVTFSAPPNGGLQATGYATLSAGTVSGITVTQQGAGYASPPTIGLQNDPREGSNGLAVGYGATAVASLTGAATVTAILCVDHGSGGITSLPSLSFSGGGGSSVAATIIMNWSITAANVTAAGAGFPASSAVEISGLDAFPTTASAYSNGKYQAGLVATRKASILVPTTSGGAITTGSPPTTAVVYDGGCYTSVPTPLVLSAGGAVSGAPTITFTMGGSGGSSYIWQIG